MPIDINDADFLLPAGQSLDVEQQSILFGGVHSTTIAGTLQILSSPSDPEPGIFGPDQAVDAIDLQLGGALGMKLLIESTGLITIDTTTTDNVSVGVDATGGGTTFTAIPLVNDGLIEIHAAANAAGISANVADSASATAAVANNGSIEAASLNGEAVGVDTSGGLINTGDIEASGATVGTGVILRFAGVGPFENSGQIEVHDPAGVTNGTAVDVIPQVTWSLSNSGLIEADHAIVAEAPAPFPIGPPAILPVGGDIENSGRVVGEIDLGGSADTLTNSGSIEGATNLGDGNDIYDGRLGTETGLVQGGAGNDTLMGGAGSDNLQGNQGNDSVSGGAGDDIVVGGKDNDIQSGGDGNDIVWGNMGNDTLDGGNGADQVRGGQGDDSISGGAGDDYISGDRGNDTESGGPGADIFHSSSGAGVDLVLDFKQAEGDRVMLDPGTAYTVSQVGQNTVVDMGNGDEVILQNVQLSSLKAGWIFEG
jgi:Ca2+-binding RTX toxin-like protein